jgi:hypothetical protein
VRNTWRAFRLGWKAPHQFLQRHHRSLDRNKRPSTWTELQYILVLIHMGAQIQAASCVRSEPWPIDHPKCRLLLLSMPKMSPQPRGSCLVCQKHVQERIWFFSLIQKRLRMYTSRFVRFAPELATAWLWHVRLVWNMYAARANIFHPAFVPSFDVHGVDWPLPLGTSLSCHYLHNPLRVGLSIHLWNTLSSSGYMFHLGLLRSKLPWDSPGTALPGLCWPWKNKASSALEASVFHCVFFFWVFSVLKDCP